MQSRYLLMVCCAALPFSFVGCGETDSNIVKTSTGQGGAAHTTATTPERSLGGGSSHTESSTTQSRTAGCPTWPAAKFVLRPLGPLFFGTHDGPCRATIGDENGIRATELFNYAADGTLESVSYTAGGEAKEFVFTWVDGLPKTETFLSSGEPYATSTFYYSREEVAETYVRTDDNGSSRQYAYALTEEGYPSTMAEGTYDPVSGSSIVESYTRFQYEDCRIQKLCFGVTAEELLSCDEYWTYAYDASGRISTIRDPTSGTDAMVFEYDCSE